VNGAGPLVLTQDVILQLACEWDAGSCLQAVLFILDHFTFWLTKSPICCLSAPPNWMYQLRMLVGRLQRMLLLWLALLGSSTLDSISTARNTMAEMLYSLASSVASASQRCSNTGSSTSAGHRNQNNGGTSRVTAAAGCTQHRQQAGFVRQFCWVMTRAVLMRTREPMLVFIEYMIFAITGRSSSVVALLHEALG